MINYLKYEFQFEEKELINFGSILNHFNFIKDGDNNLQIWLN